jgi:RimJ/RimL family protein N-acetyltransferase
MKAPILHTKRLRLIPLSTAHVSEDYVTWMNDDDVIKYLESGGNYTIKALKIYLDEQTKKEILFWAIHLKENNKHIGNIKIDPIDKTINSGEYGIMMGDKTAWGQGYASEASKVVIDYCFKKKIINRITLGVIDKNIGAVKLYKKLNFKVYKQVDAKRKYQGEECQILRMEIVNDK